MKKLIMTALIILIINIPKISFAQDYKAELIEMTVKAIELKEEVIKLKKELQSEKEKIVSLEKEIEQLNIRIIEKNNLIAKLNQDNLNLEIEKLSLMKQIKPKKFGIYGKMFYDFPFNFYKSDIKAQVGFNLYPSDFIILQIGVGYGFIQQEFYSILGITFKYDF